MLAYCWVDGQTDGRQLNKHCAVLLFAVCAVYCTIEYCVFWTEFDGLNILCNPSRSNLDSQQYCAVSRTVLLTVSYQYCLSAACPALRYFSLHLIDGTIFETIEDFEHKMCVSNFSIILFATFPIVRRFERGVITAHRSSCKVHVIRLTF